MTPDDRLQRLKDIEWALDGILKWAQNPSKYRKSHQTSIHTAIHAVRPQVVALIKDAQAETSSSEEA